MWDYFKGINTTNSNISVQCVCKKNVTIDIRSCVKIVNTTKVLKKEKVIINL